jgi:glutathione peroxidase-family protein
MRIFKLLYTITACILLAGRVPYKHIYEISFNNLDGKATDLAKYKGKKILILIVSGSEGDSGWLNQLVPFYQKYKDSVGIVAIPSVEDGYSENRRVITKKMFAGRGLKTLITEGMYTRKTSGNKQSELMQWLTKKEYNLHFDHDVLGAGHRFLLDEMGGFQFSVFPGISYEVPFIKRFMNLGVKPYPTIPANK